MRTHASPAELHQRSPESVAVFTATAPSQPFVEVGIVEARQLSRLRNDDLADVISALREEAAAQGCDGVIIVSNDDKVVGFDYDGTGGTTTLKGYRGACIVYTQPGTQNG